MSTDTGQQRPDRRPEWLRRKHGKQRSEPYLDLIAAAPRCTDSSDGPHKPAIVITTVHDLEGNELPIASDDEARNVANALYRSRPRDSDGNWTVSLPRPQRIRRRDGTWEVRCCVHDKAAGDAFVNAHPHRKVYDREQRRGAVMARPDRRRPRRAIDADQVAARQQYADVLDRAAHGQGAPDPGHLPALPPAEPGYCMFCGDRLDPGEVVRGRIVCTRCEMKQALIHLQLQEGAERRRKPAVQPQSARQPARQASAGRKQQREMTPAERVREFLAGR